MEILIGLSVGIVFFLCALKAYVTGLEHGKKLVNNQVPSVNLNPVTAIKEVVEEHKSKAEEKKILDDMENLFKYDPYAVKEDNK